MSLIDFGLSFPSYHIPPPLSLIAIGGTRLRVRTEARARPGATSQGPLVTLMLHPKDMKLAYYVLPVNSPPVLRTYMYI